MSIWESLLRRWRSCPSRACTNCWRSSAALYSLFSRRSPSSTAFRISAGRTTLSSCCSFSTSAPSFCFSSSIIGGSTDFTDTKKVERPAYRAGRFACRKGKPRSLGKQRTPLRCVIRTERYGDVTRFEMASVVSRCIGYSASAYLSRGVLIDCGFPGVARGVVALLARERAGGVMLTHHHQDHAGNAELVARSGIPVAASPATLAARRSPASFRFDRRVARGTPPRLRTPVAPFEHDGFWLIPAPGHSPDDHVVWHVSTGTLFGGDLYLGVK